MRVNLDIQSLRSFVKVAELCSFTRAAQSLSLTQPAISQQIKRLEDLLGVDLFVRDNRQVLLTLEGEQLSGYAQQMLAINDKVGTLFDRSRQREVVTLGLPEYFCEGVLQRFIVAAGLQLPSVRIEVKVARSMLLAQALAEGRVDLGLMVGELLKIEDAPLQALPLMWFASEGTSGLDGRSEIPLALFKAPCAFRSLAIRRLEESGIAWRCVYESEDLASLRSAVQAGVGVTLLPGVVEAGGLQRLQALAWLPELPAFGVWLRQRAGWEPWYRQPVQSLIEAAWAGEYGSA